MITFLWRHNSSSFPAAASDPLNVAIFTCFESMSRDLFFHELRGIVLLPYIWFIGIEAFFSFYMRNFFC